MSGDVPKDLDLRGIHQKYKVIRTDRQDWEGKKHAACFLFVLDLDHDPAAREAMKTYINLVQRSRPNLAADLRTLLKGGKRAGAIRIQNFPELALLESGSWKGKKS